MRLKWIGPIWGFIVIVTAFVSAATQITNPFMVPEENFPDGYGMPGGSYTFCSTAIPNTFNPLLSNSDSNSRDFVELAGINAAAPLGWISGDPIQIMPAILEMFEIDDFDQPTTITMKLREGLRWSDGEAMDVDDVAFTFQVYTDSRLFDLSQGNGLMVNDQLTTFEEVDEVTWRYHIPGRVNIATFLLRLNLPLLPQHVHQQAFDQMLLGSELYWNSLEASQDPQMLVGAGPYRLKEVILGQDWVFERNPFYWKFDASGTRLPYFDEVRLCVVEDRDLQLARFLNGETDDVNGPVSNGRNGGPRASDLSVIQASIGQGFEVDISSPTANATANLLSFNQDLGLVVSQQGVVTNGDPIKASLRQLFREPLFRRAVSKATDRQTIVDNILFGLATPIYQLSGLGQFDISGRLGSGGEVDPAYPLDHFAFDPGIANNLLDELDLPVGPDGLRVFGESYPAAGETVSITLTTNDDNNIRVETVTFLVEQYRELLQLEFVPNTVPFSTLVNEILTFVNTGGAVFGSWEAIYFGIGSGNVDPTSAFSQATSNGFLHFYRYSDRLTSDAPGRQKEIDEMWLVQSQLPPISQGGVVGGIEVLELASSDERFGLVRQMQLLLAEDQNNIYTTASSRVDAWNASRLANRVTGDYLLEHPYGSLLTFFERGYRKDR